MTKGTVRPYLISTPAGLLDSAIAEQKALLDAFNMKHLEVALNQRGFHFSEQNSLIEFIKTYLKCVTTSCADGVTIKYIYLGYLDLLNPGSKIMTIMDESALDLTNFRATIKRTCTVHQ